MISAFFFLLGAVLLFSPDVILRKEWSDSEIMTFLSENSKLVALVSISLGLYFYTEDSTSTPSETGTTTFASGTGTTTFGSGTGTTTFRSETGQT